MAYEIERKFLLKNEAWRSEVHDILHIKQAYLCNTDKASLRVRIANQSAYISSKTKTIDIRRHATRQGYLEGLCRVGEYHQS